MDSIDVILQIVTKTTEIQAIRLFRFDSSTHVQHRIRNLDASESEYIQKALSEKSLHSLGFWEALLRVFAHSSSVSGTLLEQSLHHNSITDPIRLDRTQLSQLRSLDNTDVAINSKTEMRDGTHMHIPMLDFDIEGIVGNLKVVQESIRLLGLKGFVLNSGNSFHFIGRDLIRENEMIDILARFVLLHPISDSSWAAHQIIERSSSLRIGKKSGQVPVVCGEVA